MTRGTGVVNSSITAGKRILVDAYGADPTGATDSTAAFVAAQTAGGSTYQLLMGIGTYRIDGDIGTFGPLCGMSGLDSALTKIDYRGAATAVKAYESTFNSAHYGGTFNGFTIDGTNASAGAVGFWWGNLQGARVDDITATNFTGTGSVGIQLKNSTTPANGWSEQGQWTRIKSHNNKTNVLFDHGSFDYAHFEFHILANNNQDGICLQNDASLEGCTLKVVGNFYAGTSNTAAVIAIDRGDNTKSSRIDNCDMYVNVECDGSTGTGHYTLLLGGGSASQFTGTGVLQFSDETVAFQGYSKTGSAQFGFSGVVQDHVLGKMTPGDAMVFHGGTQWSTRGTFGSNSSGGLNLQYGDIQELLLASGNTNITVTGGVLNRSRRIVMFLQQPASGGAGTVTWPADWYFPEGNPVLSTTNGAMDEIEAVYLPDTSTWYARLVGRNFVQGATASSSALVPWQATDQNVYLAWNADPATISTFTPTSGTAYVAGVRVRQKINVGHVSFSVAGTAAASVTSSQNFVALYDASGTRLAQTATDSSFGSTFAMVSIALAAGVINPGYYWVAFLMNASTMPVLARIGGVSGALTNAGLSNANSRAATIGTGQTSLGSTITPSSLTQTSQVPWVALAS